MAVGRFLQPLKNWNGALIPDRAFGCCSWRDFSLFLVVFLYKGKNTIVRGLSEEEK